MSDRALLILEGCQDLQQELCYIQLVSWTSYYQIELLSDRKGTPTELTAGSNPAPVLTEILLVLPTEFIFYKAGYPVDGGSRFVRSIGTPLLCNMASYPEKLPS
jgi:hypothetical protein